MKHNCKYWILILIAGYACSGFAAPSLLMKAVVSNTCQIGARVISGAPYECDELPLHAVTLDVYAIADTEVTIVQFCEMLNERPAWIQQAAASEDGTSNACYGVVQFSGPGHEALAWLTSVGPVITNIASVWQPAVPARSNHPMVNVTWYGAALYCNFRSEHDGCASQYNTNTWAWSWQTAAQTNAGYHLPTEAQWECAARGTRPDDAYPWDRFLDFSNCNVYASGDAFESDNPAQWPATTPVRSYSANGFGLYDVIGNVREWCQDWYDPGYYANSPSAAPRGPDTPRSWLAGGTNKVTRGGGWAYTPEYVSIAARDCQHPTTGARDLGFRLAGYTNATLAPTAPWVNITNAAGTVNVDFPTTAYPVAGTNNANTVGLITWANSLGGAGSVPAAATGWVFSVSLTIGNNLITITGTNRFGDTSSDSITIVRAAPTPCVDITNLTGTIIVGNPVTTYTLKGTNNTATVGLIDWSNSLGGAGSLPASATGWTFVVSLPTGTNTVVARGTNTTGTAHADTVTVVRATGAGPRNWYVSANGTGDGLSSGSPTQNLATVLAGASTDDIISLKGGDVFGAAPGALIVAVPLTLQSYGAGQAIISNTATANTAQLLNIVASGSGTTLDNILFLFMDYGGAPWPYRTIYLDNLASSITIRNCGFRHADSPGGHWNGNPFIAMYGSAHTNITIINSIFRDLRYGTSIEYRHHNILAAGCVPLQLINNTVSNYEGFVSFGGPFNRDVQVLSNRLYRCYGDFSLSALNNVSGGLFKNSYQGLGGLMNEFAYNIIFNGFPDMTNTTRFAALTIDRGYNNSYVHNNTFYGLGVGALITGSAEAGSNLRWYNNILVTLNVNTRTCLWSASGGILSGLVYSNIWNTRFALLTNEFYGTSPVSVAGNPQTDPGFASLDPGSADFLRPTDPMAKFGLNGTFIGAVNPAVPDPFVDITNANGSVMHATTAATMGGTNLNIAGSLYWTNSLGTATPTAFAPSGNSFSVNITALAVGTNVIRVWGTNSAGTVAGDSLTITRAPQAGHPSDVDKFVIVLATANYSTITLGWSNGTIIVLACTNQSYASDLSYWFTLASDVTSPWTHEDASNFPVIFYRIVSGVYTSQYDVGKYTVTLAPGTGSDATYNWLSPPLELFSNTVDYVLGTQLNYDETYFDILKAQSFIGSDAQVDTYYFAGMWTDFDLESTRFTTGCGYMLVVDATHTQPKTVAFVGKVPDAVVTNVVSAPNGSDAVYNWIGAPSPALRSFFANGLTNPVVTMETDANFDLYKHQVTIGTDAQKDWYYFNGVWDDFESGTSEQTPGLGGMLILDALHTGAETTWAAPKTR